jgi:hypothetical protein
VALKDRNAETRAYYDTNHKLETVTDQVRGIVRVSVDLDEIVREIAYRAAKNDSGRAIMLRGSIKAKRLSESVLSSKTTQQPIHELYSEVLPNEVKNDR